MINRFIAIMLTMFVCGVSGAATLHASSATHLVPIDRVLVIVNNGVITQSQVNEAIAAAKKQLSSSNTPFPAAGALRKQAINDLINQKLQDQLVKRIGIHISDDQLTKAIINIAKRNSMSLAQLKAAVEQHGGNYAKYRKQVAEQMAVAQLQQHEIGHEINVSNAEVVDYLNRAAHSGANMEYRVADILIPISSSPTPMQLHKAKLKAKQLLRQINSGKDFRTLAAGQSGGSHALKGGDLGWRKLAQLPDIFASHVKNMKVGQVIGPIHAPNGYHLIKLINIRSSKQKLSANVVRNLIYRRKFEEQLQIWLRKQRNQAYIKFI